MAIIPVRYLYIVSQRFSDFNFSFRYLLEDHSNNFNKD